MQFNDLINFVKDFNNSPPISSDNIILGLSNLQEKDHKLFMLLVNYKNGNDFLNKLKEGKI